MKTRTLMTIAALAAALSAGPAVAQPRNLELGLQIANQGDVALLEIRAQSRASLRNWQPSLPAAKVAVAEPARAVAGGPPPAAVRAAK